MELVLYLAVGALSGVLAGLFGIGGGLILVPVLIYSLTAQGLGADVLTHIAVGTSLATIVFTSVNSVLAHQKHGAILWALVRPISAGVLIGAAFGAMTASMIQGPVLQKIIGVFALCMAAQMAFNLTPKTRRPPPATPGLVVSGGIIGWASAIFGIAGGSLTVPFLVWRSTEMKKAVATSAACGVPIALAAAVGYVVTGWGAEGLPAWSTGYVYWPAVVGMAATSMVFARVGAKLAHRLDPLLLKRLFALMLVAVGCNFLLQ
ncbi:MAG: sulfite exporter TauE/SafE family protein [Thiopseudomonas sp.]|nr:sulfite exporter TauE/SafE family protein [Gammaproteobacteria bacterium]